MNDGNRNTGLSGGAGFGADRPVERYLREEFSADPELIAQGWERRFTATVNRVPEYVELYEAMGCQVRAEPIRAEEVDPDCGDCGLVLHRVIVTIYTRRSTNRAAD
jgi:hypothetical protein